MFKFQIHSFYGKTVIFMENPYFLWKNFWLKNWFLFYPVIYTEKYVLEKKDFRKKIIILHKFCVK